MNYKENTEQVTKWSRCKHIDIINPYGESPYLRLYEETVLKSGNDVFKSDGERLTKIINDLNETIELVNAETLEPTGKTITYADLQVITLSLYLQEAKKRDEEMSKRLENEVNR